MLFGDRICCFFFYFCFFFQAEDGIRDRHVTGVRRVLFRSGAICLKGSYECAVMCGAICLKGSYECAVMCGGDRKSSCRERV